MTELYMEDVRLPNALKSAMIDLVEKKLKEAEQPELTNEQSDSIWDALDVLEGVLRAYDYKNHN